MTSSRPHRWNWFLIEIYLLLLLVSFWLRAVKMPAPLPADLKAVELKAVAGGELLPSPVRLAYREQPAKATTSHQPLVLLHGSPGQNRDFSALTVHLEGKHRLLVPDLPGFGHSTRDIPDYSMRAHARYVLQMLDRLGLERVHILGFSMGGGVALNLAELAPARVASLTLLSATGVQEMELLGDYYLNRAVHGFQLAGLWLLREATPHFGLLDDAVLSVAYARNFFDSDQRPLRKVLERYEGPTLILHGWDDRLVPVQAALEHHRLVPQSELEVFDEDHFAVFARPAELASRLATFLERVEDGQAVTRATADPRRVAQSRLPFNPSDVPEALGVAALVLLLLLAVSTFASEDLTCIAAGMMIAQGRISFLLGTFACFLGIYVGDLMLFAAGRILGRPALKRAPLKWFIQGGDVERSSAWFGRQGMKVVLASRFLPGSRLPAYFAAGLLKTHFWKFALYFFLAAAAWTPALVGISAGLGGEVIRSALLQGQRFSWRLAAAGIVVLLATRLLSSLASYRGRRMLVSTWRRIVRWEFWPPWVFYVPVVAYIAWLALKHRSVTLFTAVNPAMPASGFIGESKSEILQGLRGAGKFVARWTILDASASLAPRLAVARAFMAENGLSFPVVLKPDAGQRGYGVAIVRSESELEGYLSRLVEKTILQEYAPGLEFGVFYYRYPHEIAGHILSITEKCFPVVQGNGKDTLERLILRDRRAVCMARFYLSKQAVRLWDVPKAGEAIPLVELGTHCRGAVFLDGTWVKTPALEDIIDQISRSYRGFYFGRFDIRTPSAEDFRRGENFKIVELNGVTSEVTHIYDPKTSLVAAYKALFNQWRIAFEIGGQNRRRSVQPAGLRTLATLLLEFKRRPRPQMS